MPDRQPSPEDLALARIAPIISHEIRNPLAVIKNSVYFIKTKLKASGAGDPKVDKHLGIIDSEILRADETLGEILAYARMREPAPSPQRLAALVQEAMKDLPAPEPISVKLDLASADSRVSVDAELIRPAIRHVARNALEALQGPSSAKPCLSIRTGVSKGHAFVELEDNGPGLPKEALDRLFMPFTTTKPRGIGLGLAFARKAVERHNGGLTLESSTEKGTRFRFKLPLARAPDPAS